MFDIKQVAIEGGTEALIRINLIPMEFYNKNAVNKTPFEQRRLYAVE